MSRPRVVILIAVALVALVAILIGGIAIAGGSGDGETTTTPTTTAAPSDAPGESAVPPALRAFPPQFLQCLRDRGVDLKGLDSNELLHGGGVPPQVLTACFEALHG